MILSRAIFWADTQHTARVLVHGTGRLEANSDRVAAGADGGGVNIGVRRSLFVTNHQAFRCLRRHVLQFEMHRARNLDRH